MFPLYFALLDDVNPVEVVANRVLWSLLLLAAITTGTHGWRSTFRSASHLPTVVRLGLAAGFLAVNWGTYVYAVASNQVVAASLGYFLNPLVSVGLGVIFLRERLRPLQWAAVGLALLAVVVLAFSYGAVPWISLILAFSFGIYGLLKKQASIGAVPSLTIETAVLAPLAAIVVIWFLAQGTSALETDGPGTWALLALLGPVTAVPLLAFGGAAIRIPLSTLGLLQYITPVFQFLIGVVVFGEAMTATRWAGFIIVWACLVLVSIDGLRAARSGKVAPGESPLEREVIEPD